MNLARLPISGNGPGLLGLTRGNSSHLANPCKRVCENFDSLDRNAAKRDH